MKSVLITIQILYLCAVFPIFSVVDGVINTLTHNQPPSLSSHSRNDQFYTNLSKFGEFFPALVQYQRKIMESLDETQDKWVQIYVPEHRST